MYTVPTNVRLFTLNQQNVVCIFCKTGFNYLKGNVVGYYCFSHLEPDLNEKLNVSGLIDLYKCDVFNLHLFI